MSLSNSEYIKTGSINDHIHEIEQLTKGRQVFILCDENTFLFTDILLTSLPLLRAAKKIKIKPGENHKTLKSAQLIWEFLSENKADRNSVLINFGGGMITDLGGFAASTYKRGINYINIPTSLLAMIDASVGGKTGVNLNHEKNQIGIFSIPNLVLCDPFFLKTQTKDQISSGFAEIIKHGLIIDKEYWEYCTKDTFENLDINQIIQDSIRIKATIVTEDPHEKGIRKVLNFGHTIGHAIETLFINKNTTILHGHAVAAGIYIESFLSYIILKLPELELKEIQHYIISNYKKLPIEKKDIKEVLEIMKNDKKRNNNKYNFSLIYKIGKASFDNYIDEDLIELALNDYLSYS